MKEFTKIGVFIFTLLASGILLSQTTLDLINTYDISGSVSEPSGLAYDKVNNQLFSVSDGNNTVYRLSVTGALLESYSFSGDLEGVSMYNTPNTLLIAIEDTYELVEYNYQTGASTSHTMDYDNINDSGSGIEGVTYNATTGEIYFLNEKDEGALLVADSNFNVTEEYILTYSEDYSASYYVEETGFLWLGSDNSSTIYKCNTDGSVVETFPITQDGTSNGDALDKLEGLAIDQGNQLLYAITDGGEKLYVYKINESRLSIADYHTAKNVLTIYPVPATTSMSIELNTSEIVTTIRFYNEIGQLRKIMDTASKMIDVSNFDAGIYFVEILTNKNNWYRKAMVVN